MSPVNEIGKLLIVFGVLLALAGLALVLAGRVPWLGRLPGDIHVQRGNWTFYFPLATSLLLSVVLTLVLCSGVYVIGLLSDYWFGQPAVAGAAWLYKILYAIVPNFQFFWAGDALTQGRTINPAHVVQVVTYAGLYSLGILGLGLALFQTREVS